MRSSLVGVTAAGLIALSAAVGAAVTFTETFSGMPTGSCLADGTVLGSWSFVYDGFGCNRFQAARSNVTLAQRPMASTTLDETHGSLVLGPWASGDIELQVSTQTTEQLRTGSAPHPWEVGWVLWHFTDNVHFYYFIAKPNGWELGKADPAYPGAQRFLSTGPSPAFPVGAWYRVRVVQNSATIQVFVNDQLVTTFTDNEQPYAYGQIGLYTEDAAVQFDDVMLGTPGTPRGKKKPR